MHRLGSGRANNIQWVALYTERIARWHDSPGSTWGYWNVGLSWILLLRARTRDEGVCQLSVNSEAAPIWSGRRDVIVSGYAYSRTMMSYWLAIVKQPTHSKEIIFLYWGALKVVETCKHLSSLNHICAQWDRNSLWTCGSTLITTVS